MTVQHSIVRHSDGEIKYGKNIVLGEEEFQVIFQEFHVSEFSSLRFWEEISCAIVDCSSYF